MPKTFKHRTSQKNSCLGVTLLELLVALALAIFFVSVAFFLFVDSGRSYTLQEQMAEMNKNTRFVLQRLSGSLTQAGADLPLSWNIVDVNSAQDISILVNPQGAIYISRENTAVASLDIRVDRANSFSGSDTLLCLRNTGSRDTLILNTSYNISPYINGIDTLGNRIRVQSPTALAQRDTLLVVQKSRYFKSGSTICLNQTSAIIADDIDSLALEFFKANGSTPTTQWSEMVYADITVRGRTQLPDARYSEYPDHKRRITLNRRIRLENAPGAF